jgi:hypothetical protein
VNPEEAAVADSVPDGVSATAAPTGLPAPTAHPDAVVSGPQTENATVPVGLPAPLFPVTVTVSPFTAPSVIPGWVGVELVADAAALTVTHSPAEPSLDAE